MTCEEAVEKSSSAGLNAAEPDGNWSNSVCAGWKESFMIAEALEAVWLKDVLDQEEGDPNDLLRWPPYALQGLVFFSCAVPKPHSNHTLSMFPL